MGGVAAKYLFSPTTSWYDA